ncbi:MAG: hypothetical protein R2823_10820 [Acidimicrobiia bacterium]
MALISASCGEGPPDAGSGSALLPADATIGELAATFSVCPEPLDAIAPAAEYLEEAIGWMKVDRVVRHSDDPDRTLPATVLVQGVDSTTEEEVSIHGSYWPGIEWALASGGQVWFAMGDPEMLAFDNMVLYVLTYTPDGKAFFPGRCQHDILYKPLVQALGEEFDARMNAIPGKTGDDLVIALRGQLPVEPPDDVVILNPETAPEKLLESLQFAVVHVTLNAALGPDYTICTYVEAGWNDCFVPDSDAVTIGYAVDAYLDDTGVLEVWLLDSNANLLEPIELLGTVNVPASLADTEEIAMRIEVDTAQLSKGEPGTADLVETIPLADLDIEDPDWPGLGGPVTPGVPGP